MNGAAALLSEPFLDWWYAPWERAPDDAWLQSGWPLADPDQLARRDGYRLWCRHAGIDPDLPPLFDPGWDMLADMSCAQLRGTARLLGGLLAARAANLRALRALGAAQQRWCSAVASVQPLPLWEPFPAAVTEAAGVELAGLAQLAHLLETGFTGLWPRVRLVLAPSLGGAVDALLTQRARLPLPTLAETARVQRCWAMCRRRLDLPGGEA